MPSLKAVNLHRIQHRLLFMFCVHIFLISGGDYDLIAQDSNAADSTLVANEKVKTGWTFGLLPVISFDTDLGFQYGALVNFFNYGDGSDYPQYWQSIYLEWSRTTNGTGINRLYLDLERLIPNIRITFDVSYLTEQALNFYGFNGYDAVYNQEWEDDGHPDYVSRVFYRHDRKMFRVFTSFQGRILKHTNKYRWIAGFAYYGNEIGSVDIDRLNKGKNGNNALPDVDGLYDKYVNWGIIKPEEATGNKTTYLKAGLVYDTRDIQAFPTRGIWADVMYSYAPSFLGDGDFEYSKLTAVLRHYLSLGSKNLVFAYRLGYQGTISGTVPFHMQPHIVPAILVGATSQGLGGSKTLRGVRRNRVVGDGIVLGNAEFRWKFYKGRLFKQNFYLGTNAFLDVGRVVDKIEVDISQEEMGDDLFDDYFAPGTEDFHLGVGLGLKLGLNENFIVSFDYGVATDSRDGDSGLYIGLNFLY